MRIVLAILVPLACALALSQAIEHLSGPAATEVRRGNAVVWADRVFTSKQQLADWLEARGTSYESWAARHPGTAPWDPRPAGDGVTAAAGREEPAEAPTREATNAASREATNAASREATKAASPEESPPASFSGDGRSLPFSTGAFLLGLACLLGIALITASALPPMVYAGHAVPAELLLERRAQVGAAGLSLLVGIGIPILVA